MQKGRNSNYRVWPFVSAKKNSTSYNLHVNWHYFRIQYYQARWGGGRGCAGAPSHRHEQFSLWLDMGFPLKPISTCGSWWWGIWFVPPYSAPLFSLVFSRQGSVKSWSISFCYLYTRHHTQQHQAVRRRHNHHRTLSSRTNLTLKPYQPGPNVQNIVSLTSSLMTNSFNCCS